MFFFVFFLLILSEKILAELKATEKSFVKKLHNLAVELFKLPTEIKIFRIKFPVKSSLRVILILIVRTYFLVNK